jgi:addiction module RelE/StbE family toxin
LARIVWHPDAIEELNEIATYIARDSDASARRLIARVFDATERLVQFPTSGRALPEDPTSDARELIVGNYRVIYRVSGDIVQISSVVHAARNVSVEDVPPADPL